MALVPSRMMTSAAPAALAPMPPGFHRDMLALTAVFVSMMAALDLTIVSVALPYMAGSLDAGGGEITWAMTMFTIGQAIVIGITGFLSRLLGRRCLVLVAVVGFVTASALCGLAQDLDQLVLFRFVQGLFSGPLIPISQAILVGAYPKEQRTHILALWVIGVMGGPAVGPALGGYLAQDLGWRWVFWVNLPIGIVAVLLILGFVRAVPPRRASTDLRGLVLLILWIVCLQILLDKGNELDWLGSREVLFLGIAAITFALAFFLRGALIGPANIIDLHLLRDRNFAACALLIAMLGSLLLALLILTPLLIIEDLRWEIMTAGIVIGGFGILGLAGGILSPHLAARLGVRSALIVGCLLLALGWYLFSRIDLDAGPIDLFLSGALIELGLMICYPILAAQAFADLRPDQHDEGAGLFNFTKTLGFSFGVTFVEVLIYRGDQANWNAYAGQVSLTNPGLSGFLEGLGIDPASQTAGAVLGAELAGQTRMLTIVQSAEVLMVLALVSIPLVFLLDSGRR
jgi:MFS transporter, DHA2 family, multidrug resistance protein